MNYGEFKFRFWNKIAQRFQPASKYAIDGKGDLVAYDYEMGAYNDAVPFSKTCIVAQQYTGLKDKNGKEIYEGDFVRREGPNYYYTVEYNVEEASYILRDLDGDYIYLCDFEVVVVGNMYETPELLNQLGVIETTI